MKSVIAGLVAFGLFPVAALAGHDRYDDRDVDVRVNVERSRYDDGGDCRPIYRRHEPRTRYYDDYAGERVSHHVHRRVHHHYDDYGDHGHVRHHVHRRVHHHYDEGDPARRKNAGTETNVPCL